MTLRVLSLFSGIGGIDLGLERAGMCVVAQCEIDPFCQRVLAKHWPEVPRHGDIRTYRPEAGAADLVAGGFPCQPWSSAGRQRGRDDARHLWPEFARVVADVRPRWVLGENVPGIRARGADEVLADLEALGYACWPLVVAAADVGAPHERARVWFVGLNVADCNRKLCSAREGSAGEERAGRTEPRRGCSALAFTGEPRLAGRRRRAQRAGPQEPVLAGGGDAGELADAARDRRPGASAERAERERVGDGRAARWPSRPGQPQHEWEAPRLVSAEGLRAVVERELEPALGAATDGLLRRLARWRRAALKAVGNAVVPQVVELVGRAILAADAALRAGAGGVA